MLSPGEFSNFVPDTGATQEVAVDYGAISAELAFGGLRINLIPKEGGNTFKGSLFATGVNCWWQNDNLTTDLQTRGLPAPNKMKLAYDVNPSFGGPIMKDRLWFFASGRAADEPELHRRPLRQRQRGRSDQVDVRARSQSNQDFFKITQKGINGRVTWQASQRNKFSLYLDNQSRVWDDRRAGVSPESVVELPLPDASSGSGGLDLDDLEQAAARSALCESRRELRQPTGLERSVETR